MSLNLTNLVIQVEDLSPRENRPVKSVNMAVQL